MGFQFVLYLFCRIIIFIAVIFGMYNLYKSHRGINIDWLTDGSFSVWLGLLIATLVVPDSAITPLLIITYGVRMILNK